MSMRGWTEEGFGYRLFNEHNFKQVCDFIVEHNYRPLTQEELDELEEIVEERDEYNLFCFFDNPASWRVADIINDLEGITLMKGFQKDGNTGQETCIGLAPRQPWEMNDKDKLLTRKTAEFLLLKYATLLSIDEKPDYFVAEYFG